MKIKEFIEELKKFNQDMLIYTRSDRGVGQEPQLEIEEVMKITQNRENRVEFDFCDEVCSRYHYSKIKEEDRGEIFNALMIPNVD